MSRGSKPYANDGHSHVPLASSPDDRRLRPEVGGERLRILILLVVRQLPHRSARPCIPHFEGVVAQRRQHRPVRAEAQPVGAVGAPVNLEQLGRGARNGRNIRRAGSTRPRCR